jgi:hypothetical protein
MPTTIRSRRPAARRLRKAPALAGLTAAAVLALVSCTSNHEAKPAANVSATAAGSPSTTAPSGVISPAQAAKILAAYAPANDRANRQRSDAINTTIETGVLSAQSQAEYQMYPHWPASLRPSIDTSFTYTDPRFYIPRAAPLGQRPFFLAVARGQETHVAHPASWTEYLLFVQTPQGWRLTAAVSADKGQTVPAMAQDAQGFAIALAPDTPGLALRPSALSSAVLDNYITGGRTDGAIFAATLTATEQRGQRAAAARRLAPATVWFTAALNPYPHDIFALRTADGGALVLASEAHEEHDLAAPPGYLTLSAHTGERAWITRTNVNALNDTFTCNNLAAVPVRGQAQLLGTRCELTFADAH